MVSISKVQLHWNSLDRWWWCTRGLVLKICFNSIQSWQSTSWIVGLVIKESETVKSSTSKKALIKYFPLSVYSFQGVSGNFGSAGQKGEVGYPGPYVRNLKFYSLLLNCVNVQYMICNMIYNANLVCYFLCLLIDSHHLNLWHTKVQFLRYGHNFIHRTWRNNSVVIISKKCTYCVAQVSAEVSVPSCLAIPLCASRGDSPIAPVLV